MAKITIRTASVERIITGNKGFVAAESYTTRAGEKKQQQFTVWVDDPSAIPPEGATVNVTGNVSARVNEYTYQGAEIKVAQINVNQPEIVLVSEPGVDDTAPEVTKAPENWTDAFAAEAPF